MPALPGCSAPQHSAPARSSTAPRSSFTRLLPLAALLALGVARPAAAGVRVVASDSRGVTLQLTVGAWTLSAPDEQGRVRVQGLGDAHTMAIPGRPMLPAWSATLALPPGARPSARVLTSTGEQARSGTRIVIAGRPAFGTEPDSKLGPQPLVEPVEPIVDGVWPPSSVELAVPFGFRGRRLVALELRPFRYDETSARVSSPLELTVRVDFDRPAAAAAMPAGLGAPDRHVDAALASSVVNWEQGSAWRLPPSRTSASSSLFSRRPAGGARALAFEDDQPEVRVKLDETALYRLPFDDLVAKGYPIGVPVADVSVHRHEFLEGAQPPYGTVELPCEIQDANQNNLFDSGDAIWLWVRNWAERSNATNIRRFWGDAEVVFVTRKPGGGLRVAQRPGWNGVPGLTPPASYPFKKHFEKDFASIMPFVTSTADTNIGVWHWTQFALYYSRPDTIRVETNDLDNTRDVDVTVRWVGRAYDFHVMWAAFRNGLNQVTTFEDSTSSWFGKAPFIRSATLPGTTLTEGNTNFFRQWGKNQFAPPSPSNNAISFAGLDWFDLTYWRRYRAVSDLVRFNSSDGTGDVQMSVGGFTRDSLRVYDVTDPDQPVRLTMDPAHVAVGTDVTFEIQDVVAGSARREYVAAAVQDPPAAGQGPRVPPASAYSAVTRRQLWAQSAGDYLLVVPEAFAPATPPLVALRTSQGLSVLQAPVESIYDEFDGGRHSAAAIQRFARYAYEHWDSRFLMLVGDGTLDPMGNRAKSGVDWIPVLPTPGPVGTGEGLEIIPSDNRYGFLTGNEDPISSPDSNRVVPELMVGRLTVNSLADATNQIDKIVAYENVQQPDDWRRNVLLNADDAFSGETTFGGGGSTTGYCHRSYEELFVGLNQTMHGFIASDSGVAGMNVEEFNLRYYLTKENTVPGPFGDTCRVDRNETRQNCHSYATPLLLGKLNAGQLLWNYQGHANEFVLTHEDLYVNSGTGLGDDSYRLANDNKPFVFTAFSCHANMFARPEHQLDAAIGPALGEDLMALPNRRGAVASWASVCFEVVPRAADTHVNVELIRSLFVNPPHDEFLGTDDRGARVVLGEAILSTLFRYIGTTQSFAPERGLSITYALLGDPATRLPIGRPLSEVLANGTPVTSGTPVRLHTLGDTLRIDANVVSNSRVDSLALFVNDGSGGGDVPVPSVDYTITPAFPDTVQGGTLYGAGRRYHLEYHTQPAARSIDYAVVTKDRYGLARRTNIALRLEGVLRVNGTPIADNDEVAPNAVLSLLLLSPAPIANPLTDLTLTIGGSVQPFAAVQAPGDASGREWILNWTHSDYPIDDYPVQLAVQGGGTLTLRFRVTASASRLALRDLFPFPNPFDNSGTRFSFLLLGSEVADVKLRVFSQSGRSIYTEAFRGLNPGYHQLAWNGNDAEGDPLANGIYFFRLSATTASGATTEHLGRLVKLRKPKRTDEPTVP